MDAPTANANGTITPTLRLTRTAASSGATKLVFRSPRSDSPQEGEARLRAWAGQGTTSRPHIDDQDFFPIRHPTYAALETLAAYVYRHFQSHYSPEKTPTQTNLAIAQEQQTAWSPLYALTTAESCEARPLTVPDWGIGSDYPMNS